jgi:hypothetical protein
MARTPAAPMPAPAPMQQPVAPPVQMQRKPSLLEAIAAASSGFGDLTKDSKNDYLKSQYLGLPGLLKAIKPPLIEQGVVVYSQVVYVSNFWVVRTTLAFADGSEEVSSDFPIPDPTNQQRIGAVITYGTRYNLFALLAICPENDDDGNSGGYAAPAASSQGLPGLPGGVQYAPVMQPQYQQPAAMPPAIAYPVQPLPVLS